MDARKQSKMLIFVVAFYGTTATSTQFTHFSDNFWALLTRFQYNGSFNFTSECE